ncbi:MAG TPA: hypothetical protein VHL11_02255, partial [Phototrophicaceae bacterium]|nr:hypothetical protein [Phototrophicaceae bacterium]
ALNLLRASAYAAGFQSPQVKTIFARRGTNRNPRRYFEQPKRLKSTARKYGSVPHIRYLWRGVNRSGAHIYEPNENGHPITFVDEMRLRCSRAERKRLWLAHRAYLDWFNEEKKWSLLEA